MVTIECVAILDEDHRMWSLPSPARHHDVLAYMKKEGKFKPNVDDGGWQQGFKLSNGLFADRREAMHIAKASGQFRRRSGDGYYQGPELFSEDLW